MDKIKRIKKNDLIVQDLWDKCAVLGIEADITKRWEQGIEHHQRAEEIFDMIKQSDWTFGGDYFCWKEGGDGDNGEHLKYALSIYCELEDKGAV